MKREGEKGLRKAAEESLPEVEQKKVGSTAEC